MRFILSIIMLVAIGAGASYLWNTYISDQIVRETEPEAVTETTTELDLEENTDIETPTTSIQTAEPETVPVAAEPVTIDTNVLSDDQQQLLQTFGIDTDAIEVTADMIGCAEEKLGDDRLEEIIRGNLPTFFEGLSLATCYSQ